MNDLIMITFSSKFGFNTVSARELHEKLNIRTQYKDWFPRMCEYGFEENKDFIVTLKNERNPKGGKQSYTEHYISIDMAKEICMLQRSEIGKKFRRYFIECEKKMNGGNHALVSRIAGSDGKALEYVAKWRILQHRPHLTAPQVDTICRLLPLFPEIRYSEIARLSGISVQSLARIRKLIIRMQGA
ncbi:MAG: antA/AntB antirepressor family protein [Spirochaetales bacterium]|nr:antA/AntB antirepressor family protein [Spirochaetales bacterium]